MVTWRLPRCDLPAVRSWAGECSHSISKCSAHRSRDTVYVFFLNMRVVVATLQTRSGPKFSVCFRDESHTAAESTVSTTFSSVLSEVASLQPQNHSASCSTVACWHACIRQNGSYFEHALGMTEIAGLDWTLADFSVSWATYYTIRASKAIETVSRRTSWTKHGSRRAC